MYVAHDLPQIAQHLIKLMRLNKVDVHLKVGLKKITWNRKAKLFPQIK